MIKIAFSPTYVYKLPEGHRFPMEKYELLPEQLIREGSISENQFFLPEALSNDKILLTHDSSYLHKLESLTLTQKEIRNIGFPVKSELVTRGRIIAAGTYQCALHALQDGISLNIAGGTHHAFHDRGEGFCIFNDVCIASSLLLHQQLVQRILILDLDVHQGNGTAKIFENNNSVFTFSMHGEKNYPTRKEKSSLDIGLPDKTEGTPYLNILNHFLPKIIDEFCPDLVFYNAGVDVLDTDKLGRLNLSKAETKKRDFTVFSMCQKFQIPLVTVMGGGYSHKLSDILDAHVNTFRSAFEVFG